MKLNEVHFLVTAFVLHLTLPVAAYVAPSTEPRINAVLPAAREEVDVEVAELPQQPPDEDEPLPAREPVGPGEDDQEPGYPKTGPKPHLRRAAVAPLNTASPDEPPSDQQDTLKGHQDDGHAGGTDEYALPPSDGVGGPGGPGSGRIWEQPGIIPDDDRPRPAPTSTPKRDFDPNAGTKAIADGVRENDKQKGLDFPAAGFIKRKIHHAVYASETPHECTANLTVTLSGAGRVTTVRLNSFSGGSRSVWEDVRRRVLASLKGASFPMKSAYKKGAIINYGVTSTKESPVGGPELDGATVRFDPSDIGTHPTRRVRVGFNVRPAD